MTGNRATAPPTTGAGQLLRRRTALHEAQGLARRLGYRARAHGRTITRWNVPVTRVRGRLHEGRGERSVLVAGWKRTVEYYLRRFFEEADPPEPVATSHVLQLPRLLRRLRGEADLVIARVPAPASKWLFGDAYLRVPEAVEARLVVPEHPDALARASTRARRNLSRVRRNGLGWSLSFSDADFEEFYSDHYLPFLRRRYADLGHEIDRRTLRRAFRRGGLLWVLHEKRRVAAALVQAQGDVLHWRVMGAPNEGPDPAKTGALAAIYVFGVECARLHGLRYFDLGYSKSSLRDGVLSHKCSWGAGVYCPWQVDHDLLFGWERLDGAVASFLHDTPLIIREGTGLSAVSALAPEVRCESSAAVAAHRKLLVPGLERLYLLSRHGWEDGGEPGAAEAAPGLWLSGPVPSRCLSSSAARWPDRRPHTTPA